MEYKTKIDLLEKENKTMLELDKAINIVAPILIGAKKITKREIDKANKLLIEELGIKETYYHEYKKEYIQIPYYYMYKKEYNNPYLSDILIIVGNDRSIKEKDNYYYIPNNERHLYGTGKTITQEELNRSIYNGKKLTREEIENNVKEYLEINKKIEELKEEQDKIDQNGYIKELF